LKNLRNRFNRFCLRNRNKGIPNLMLFVAVGTFFVSLLYNLGYYKIYSLLAFDFGAIMKGEVWRLFTYIFTLGYVNVASSSTAVFDVFSTMLLLYCFVSLGRAVEGAMGTLRFNFYYLSGILMMDVFGLMFGGFTWIQFQGQFHFIKENCSFLFAGNMAFFLYLSLVICYSTLYPESQFLLFFIIPIKAWLLALFYFIYLIYQIIAVAIGLGCYPQCLFPLVGLANYFLFFGKDAGNLIPMSWKVKAERGFRRKKPTPKKAGTVPFPGAQAKKETHAVYTHRCTVCGKTDVTNPELEFRYCSRCNGYFCYCEDHINNHTHIE